LKESFKIRYYEINLTFAHHTTFSFKLQVIFQRSIDFYDPSR
jgi:hypothetical protein